MSDLVKFMIIVIILVGIVMLAAGQHIGQTVGGILTLWGIAGWTTVEEKR